MTGERLRRSVLICNAQQSVVRIAGLEVLLHRLVLDDLLHQLL
jgi:hypothetical protein